MDKQVQLRELIKANARDYETWKGDNKHTQYTRMQTLRQLKEERVVMMETWKKMTGQDYTDVIPEVAAVVTGSDDGGDNGKELTRV